MALALGKRPRRKIPVPFITPSLSALWLGLLTPVDTKVARPLIEGLSTATVVDDPPAQSSSRSRPSPSTRRWPARLRMKRGFTGAQPTARPELRYWIPSQTKL